MDTWKHAVFTCKICHADKKFQETSCGILLYRRDVGIPLYMKFSQDVTFSLEMALDMHT